MPWKKFLLHDGRCKWTCLRKQWVSAFLFTVFIFNGTLPFRMLTNNTYTYTILFMNLMMICKLHQWNKTYFNRQSNDLQSLVELCVAQPSRSQVTGRKEPWERGCVLISSCLLYQNPSSSRSDYQNRGSPIFSITGMITDRIGRYESNFCYNFIIIITIFEKKKHYVFLKELLISIIQN